MQRLVQKEHWLKAAKRLPVGATDRIYHGAEKRPNLVIRNQQDKYTAYCHHCHQGDVLYKDAVRIQAETPVEKSKRGIPDLVPADLWTPEEELKIKKFLVSKDMAMGFFGWSMRPLLNRADNRLVFRTPDQIVGRDLTGRAPAKWFTYYGNSTYNRAKHVEFQGVTVVLTEDYMSALKLQYVFNQKFPKLMAVAVMGTKLCSDLTVQLTKARNVIILFDGDSAGYKGAEAFTSAFDVLDIPYMDWTGKMPENCDPKNLSTEAIYWMFHGQEST